MAATSTTRHPLDLLVVSDIWPPPFIGGYELGAHDIVSRLAARGHRVTVLTSTFGATATAPAPGVHRVLHEHIQWRPLPWPALVADTVRAMRTLPRARRLLDTAVFDLIYLFNPLGLNAAFVQALCDTGRPLVAYVSDDWIAQWPRCDRLWVAWTEARSYLSPARRIGMALARRLLLRRGFLPEEAWRIPIRHAQFVSRHIQKVSTARIAPTTQEVIPWGIAVDRFPYRERRAAELHEWIVCGQVEPHKGIATVVDAVALLRGRGHPVRVTLHGADTTPFARTLKDRVARDGLADAVRFAGAHPRELLAERAYGPAGLLVFASEWEEPFSITLLEAFASGLPVLTTLTGGTGEIARHGDTATVFTAGDSAHLAAQWEALVRRPDRALAMARRAREIVARHLTIDGMVDRVEQHLLGVAEGRGSTGSEPWIPRPHPWEPSDVAADAPSRAVVPDAEDGTWVAALWRDLGRFGVIESAEPEIDAAFPAPAPAPAPRRHAWQERLAAGRRLEIVPSAHADGALLARLVDAAGGADEAALAPDLERLPFADAGFDAAVVLDVLGRCARPWHAVRELRRVLRPGGHLLLSAPCVAPLADADRFRFTPAGLAALAEDAGLVVVDRGGDGSVQHTLATMLWDLVRHHPQQRHLATSDRAQHWLHGLAARTGHVLVPTLAAGAWLVARRPDARAD